MPDIAYSKTNPPATKPVLMFLLLALLVFIWGVGWPVIKVGLRDCPPVWFAALRLDIAFLLVLMAMTVAGRLVWPNRQDLPAIFSIGFLQIGLFVFLITEGLQYVSPGRSAIIAYIAPFFVTPVAVLFFKETLSGLKILGLLLGLAGIAVLFSPWGLNWHDHNTVLGNGLLLLSALSWSGAMLHTRYGVHHKPAYMLLPWQILLGAVFNTGIAFFLHPHPVIHVTSSLILSLLYVAILATSLGYWAMVVLGRYYPVIIVSVALLATPVIGLLASAWMVGEKLTPEVITAMVLIILGLFCVAFARK